MKGGCHGPIYPICQNQLFAETFVKLFATPHPHSKHHLSFAMCNLSMRNDALPQKLHIAHSRWLRQRACQVLTISVSQIVKTLKLVRRSYNTTRRARHLV